MKKKYIIIIVVLAILIAVVLALTTIFKNNDQKSNSFESLFNNSQTQSLPDFSEFIKHPSDTFIIKPADYSKITRATPMFGDSLSCKHPGGHIHFTPQKAPYYTDIVSPVDGFVDMIDKCFDLGSGTGKPEDKFGISVAFAKVDGKTLSFSFSIEPFAGQLCKNNPDYYLQYVLVKNGEQVKKGQVIARMPKLTSDDDSTHVHFNLTLDGSNTPICPDIFTSKVEEDFFNLNDQTLTCDGKPVPPTFCYMPSSGEKLVR